MRWGLIGASTIAEQHMIAALRDCGQDIAIVQSGTDNRAKSFAKAMNIPAATTTIDSLFADPSISAVYVSSTNEKHHDQAMAAIAAGRNVICEKPLAMTLRDAVAMVKAAEKAGVVFATNHHLRCSGSHRKIRELIRAGRIGTVLSLRVNHAVHLPENLRGWRINDAAAGGGVIPDITVHDADVVRFLLGEDPVDVVAQSTSSGMGQGVEDSCMSVWRMPSGAMVFAHESFTHPFAGSGLEVHGTLGSIFASDVMTQLPIGSITLTTHTGKEAIPFDRHSLYVQAVSDFLRAVEGKGQPAATGSDGVKSLAVAHAVRDAAIRGTRTPVDYGDL